MDSATDNRSISSSPTWLLAVARRFVDTLFPPQCLKCRALVDTPGTLCADCWREVTFIAPPFCAACGTPFAHETGPDAFCGACLKESPPYGRARAVFVYTDASRDLVLRFKHADATHAAAAFGKWLARAGSDLIAEADVLVPVPLHWTRLFRRRYNQSALLAQALGKETGLPVVERALTRRRATPSLGRLNRSARRRRLAGAIASGKMAQQVSGKRVLLIDDVLTTGETAAACIRPLTRAGATGVDVLTLARVVRTET